MLQLMFKHTRQDTYGSINLKIPIQLLLCCTVKSMLLWASYLARFWVSLNSQGANTCTENKWYCKAHICIRAWRRNGLLSVRARTTEHSASHCHTPDHPHRRGLGPLKSPLKYSGLSCETEHLKALTNLKRDPSHPEPLLNEISIPVSSIARKSSCSVQGNIFYFPAPCASILQMKFSLTFRLYEILKLNWNIIVSEWKVLLFGQLYLYI